MQITEKVQERFWKKVKKTETCWNWTGMINDSGYGNSVVKTKWIRSHRLSLMISGINVPNEMVVDHICRNRKCVNPSHLRIVTRVENCMNNSVSPVAKYAQRTHCKCGLELSGSNLVENLFKKFGWRYCKYCRYNNYRKKKEEKKGKDGTKSPPRIRIEKDRTEYRKLYYKKKKQRLEASRHRLGDPHE